MAEREQVPGRRPGSDLVIGLDGGVLRQSGSVDEDHGPAVSTDLLDFRVILGQADGHETVDRGPVDRPDQRPVKGRDEQQSEAGLFRLRRNPGAQFGEERIAEHDAQVLI